MQDTPPTTAADPPGQPPGGWARVVAWAQRTTALKVLIGVVAALVVACVVTGWRARGWVADHPTRDQVQRQVDDKMDAHVRDTAPAVARAAATADQLGELGDVVDNVLDHLAALERGQNKLLRRMQLPAEPPPPVHRRGQRPPAPPSEEPRTPEEVTP